MTKAEAIGKPHPAGTDEELPEQRPNGRNR